MTYEEALAILGDAVKADGLHAPLRIRFHRRDRDALLNSIFTAAELEAIAVYMRAHGPNAQSNSDTGNASAR